MHRLTTMTWAAKAANMGFIAAAVAAALCLVVAALVKTDKHAPATQSPRETSTPRTNRAGGRAPVARLSPYGGRRSPRRVRSGYVRERAYPTRRRKTQ